MWLSLVERLLWEQDAAGSNPVIRTTQRELPFMGGSLCVFMLRFEPAAACEQSKSLALGQNALRCRRQIKQSVLCAAVEKIKEQRKPDDFFGHRKPAAQPKMPPISNPAIQTRKAKSGNALGFLIYGSVYSPSIYTVSAPMADAPVTSSAALIPNMKIR